MDKQLPIARPDRPAVFLGLKRIHICEYERGVLWTDGECSKILGQGTQRFFDPCNKIRISIYNRRTPWLTNGENEKDGDKDVIIDSGIAHAEIETLTLGDGQLATVHVDGRYNTVLGPGSHAWWKGLVKVDVSVKDLKDEIRKNNGRIDPVTTAAMQADPNALAYITLTNVPAQTKTAMFRNGELKEFLSPGWHAFWTGSDSIELRNIDTREQTADINGQELLTADKLSVRLNAVLSYRITDLEKSLSAADIRQVLYREAQLVLRAQVGALELDRLLADKDSLSECLKRELEEKAAAYGLSVVSFGVRDVILPGEVKNLLMKAADARASSEAATIRRREETAAMRHQLNTAKMLSDNPALMRLRELETVEKITEGGKLTVILGDKGLAEKVADMM